MEKNSMYEREFDIALDLIKSAYENIIKDSTREVSKKPDKSLVTKLDTMTEEYITNGILSEFGSDNFLSEEYHATGKLLDRTWIIDPIDGTTNFSNNIPLWSIQLAFYADGGVQFSIMYFPELDQLFTARKGSGVYLNGARLEYTDDESLDKHIVQYIGGFKKYIEELTPIYKLLVDYCQSQRYDGCASFGYNTILCDRSNTLVSYRQDNPWDEMPGDFMCQELGLYIVDNTSLKGKLRVYTRSKEIKELFENYK